MFFYFSFWRLKHLLIIINFIDFLLRKVSWGYKFLREVKFSLVEEEKFVDNFFYDKNHLKEPDTEILQKNSRKFF